MRVVFTLFCLLFATQVLAESSSLNLQLPNAQGNYASDKFRAGDLDCSNAIGGSTQFEFGVTGIIDNYQSPLAGGSGDSTRDVGVYARVIVPLDGPKERVNCNTLYQLELKKKRLEIMRLEAELAKLKNLQGGQNE